MRTGLTFILSSLGIIFAASAASAQQTSSYYSGTQTNGLFGSNTLGGTSSGSTGNSLSSGSGGATGGGSAQQNVAVTARNTAPTVQLTQQRGAFVGADSSDTTNLRSLQNATQGRNGGASGLAQLQSLFGGNPNALFGGQYQGATQTRPQVRLTLKLGFKPQPVSTTRVQMFESRLMKLPGINWAGPAQVMMEGRTAVLRGTVATEEDRDLAAALAKMEPDVLSVRNELVVADSPESAGESVPPAAASSP